MHRGEINIVVRIVYWLSMCHQHEFVTRSERHRVEKERQREPIKEE